MVLQLNTNIQAEKSRLGTGHISRMTGMIKSGNYSNSRAMCFILRMTLKRGDFRPLPHNISTIMSDKIMSRSSDHSTFYS